jgi:hypothetical protein
MTVKGGEVSSRGYRYALDCVRDSLAGSEERGLESERLKARSDFFLPFRIRAAETLDRTVTG